jgi:23S rRNA pseudouridine1911/1915/1917 synthase
MGEFWYGASPLGEIRRHGSFYPSCTGKCGPLLRFMLEGLEVDPDPLSTFSPTQVQNQRFCPPAPTESSPAVQNRPLRTSTLIKPAAQVQNGHFCTSEPTESSPEVQNQRPCTPIPIVYEDEALLVIDKPSGLLSVPGRNNPVSALSLLQKEHGPLYPCHRLDMDTSGLMVVAKTEAAMRTLTKEFASHANIRKTYLALVHGTPVPAEGRVENLIGRCPWDRKKMAVVEKNGKTAVTNYSTRSAGRISLVECVIETGRTHQIRVHMASLGCPIAGDALYGRPGWDRQLQPVPARQMLHAWKLELKHPVTRAQLAFEATIPSDFSPWLRSSSEAPGSSAERH